MAERYRTHAVGTTLDEQQYALFCQIRQALGLTVRDLLLIVLRSARRILVEERRRQPSD